MCIRTWLATLFCSGDSLQVSAGDNSYIDLTPSTDADKDGIYSHALLYAVEEDKIKNIALTGPYGSGKSSIIQTFEKKAGNKYKFLNISLASFKEIENSKKGEEISEAREKEIKQEEALQNRLIEKSILQQMLYGADANNLPYSRFKRILTPAYSLFKSFIFCFWIIGLYASYNYGKQILNLELSSVSWILLLSHITFTLTYLVYLVDKVYKASFNVSFSKISLKNAEIQTSEIPEDSILNRHLEEIIYFFQTTNYNVVVIEDLDRFGDPEIFVKLREINKLINDNCNEGVCVSFLYALKDDMFVHKNRAKFFDFIIPIVPVINASNSLDKMQERLDKIDIKSEVSSQFLREVSLYVTDLRLIHNIFNEFNIYYKNIKSDNLDVTKLLSMMIYKNLYPSDFEALHHEDGVLFYICNKRNSYIEEEKKSLNKKIHDLNEIIKDSKNEVARSIDELIYTYIGCLVSISPDGYNYGIKVGNRALSYNQLANYDEFKLIANGKSFHFTNQQLNRNNYHIVHSISDVDSKISGGETFLIREERIGNKNTERMIEIKSNIDDMKCDIRLLPRKRLNCFLKNNNVIDDVLNNYNFKNGELFKYLVLNGHLDENYYLYTSNFHEGRLTKVDREFLIDIRNFNNPEFDRAIDTPSEVCISMRDEDFFQKYIMNVILMNYLLSDLNKNISRLSSAMSYISGSYNDSSDFIKHYLRSGEHSVLFVKKLSETWCGFSAAVIESNEIDTEIAYILNYVDADYVANNMNEDGIISNYLSENNKDIYCSEPRIFGNKSLLSQLGVKFKSLLLVSDNNNDDLLIDYIHKNNLYQINPENISFIINWFNKKDIESGIDMNISNYTKIRDVGSDNLKEYVSKQISEYLHCVFFAISSNTQESEESIISLLNNRNLDFEQKENVITKQDHVFSSFMEIPEGLWGHLVSKGKVDINWTNISAYLQSDVKELDVISTAIGITHNVNYLSSKSIRSEITDVEVRKLLSKFLMSNSDFDNETYSTLTKTLPYSYTSFPENTSKEKDLILAINGVVKLTNNSFSAYKDDNEIIATLIEGLIPEYISKQDEYPVNDDVRKILLKSEIASEYKVLISQSVSINSINTDGELSKLIANLLRKFDFDMTLFEDEVLLVLIESGLVKESSAQILIKCISGWSEERVMEVLQNIGEPYSNIASYGKRPKINKTPINLALAEKLKAKGYISKSRDEGSSIRIYTKPKKG
jgi:hypothetical protein